MGDAQKAKLGDAWAEGLWELTGQKNPKDTDCSPESVSPRLGEVIAVIGRPASAYGRRGTRQPTRTTSWPNNPGNVGPERLGTEITRTTA